MRHVSTMPKFSWVRKRFFMSPISGLAIGYVFSLSHQQIQKDLISMYKEGLGLVKEAVFYPSMRVGLRGVGENPRGATGRNLYFMKCPFGPLFRRQFSLESASPDPASPLYVRFSFLIPLVFLYCFTKNVCMKLS